jgi:uncharacterized membrane protein YdjX (TVP38/TMEM64 family)
MNERSAGHLVRWAAAATAIVVPLGILLWLNQGAVLAFIDFVRDREAVIAYLDSLGAIGPLVLMGLIGLQVLIPSLPAEPPMMAAAYAYGFPAGFLMSWVVSVAASQAVFYLARYAGRPLVERLVPAKLLDKWARAAGERGTMFFLLAFVIPPIPSDILIYVAGLSEIESWHFFVASFFGRMPMIVLLTLVGAYGSSITSAMIVGLTAVSTLMLMAWLYYVRQSAEAEASSVPSEADGAELIDSVPFRWRDANSDIPLSGWRARGTFRFGQWKQSDQAGPASGCLDCTTCDGAT